MPLELTEKEKAILSIVQEDLPDSLEPYAELAARCGSTEQEVLKLLKDLKGTGVIRRFGASLRHHRTQWSHNAMVAWKATEEEAEAYAPLAASFAAISHIYYRPSSALDWPYTLYTMIHGRSAEECAATVEGLLALWPLRDYVVLRTVREWKKISMTYF